jgi:hypothetical protein
MSKRKFLQIDGDAASPIFEAPPVKRECVSTCERLDVSCPNKECRHWMDYEGDLNCTLVAVDRNPEGLTLRDIGDRLGISFVRVCQIERAAAGKLKEKLENTPAVK